MGAVTSYARDYYLAKQNDWSASAAAIAAAVLQVFPVRSVVDVGCGSGHLLAAFARMGVTDVLGIDGEHVPRDLLQISSAQFRAADLTRLDRLDRSFDLACSMEFAEHLPKSRAADFVALLAEAAPVVLFSAAVPGQGGLGHINEQRQSYWAALFARHGRVPIDCIRPVIYGVPGVAWYYGQNALVYCPPAMVPCGWTPVVNPLYLDLLDERVFERLRQGPDSIRGALQTLGRDAAALFRAMRRRTGLGGGRPVMSR